MNTAFKPAVKVLIFYAIFMALYGLYKFFPVFPISLVGAVNESNFQHYKATFFSYIILNLIEYAFYRKSIPNLQAYLFPRLLTAVFAPWIVFLLWYIAPALYGKWPLTVLEIIYANVIFLLSAACAVIFENNFAQMPYTRPTKTVILALFIISISLYLIFTHKLPWADVFVEPNWR